MKDPSARVTYDACNACVLNKGYIVICSSSSSFSSSSSSSSSSQSSS